MWEGKSTAFSEMAEFHRVFELNRVLQKKEIQP